MFSPQNLTYHQLHSEDHPLSTSHKGYHRKNLLKKFLDPNHFSNFYSVFCKYSTHKSLGTLNLSKPEFSRFYSTKEMPSLGMFLLFIFLLIA